MSRPRIQENLTKEVAAWSNGKFNLQEKEERGSTEILQEGNEKIVKKRVHSKEKNYTFQTE